MTIKELAKIIADDFNEAVVEAECENFKEMRFLYDWDAKDIRSEIEYMVNEYGGDSGIGMLDDCTVINFNNYYDENNECSYGTFKKMIFANVK